MKLSMKSLMDFLKELSEDYGFPYLSTDDYNGKKKAAVKSLQSFRMMNMISTAWTSRKMKKMKLRRANNPSLFIRGVDRVAYGGGLENRWR